MPKMSMTMTEGELLAWHCKVGDVINAGDVVCEVATDKIDMEVEATASGTVIELRGEIGDVIDVGVPMIIVDAETDDLLAGIFDAPAPVEAAPPQAPAADAVAIPAQVVTQPAATAVVVNENVLATPKARAVANELDVDLHYVVGSGTDGVIKHTDVAAAQDSNPNPARTIANRAKARGAIAKALTHSAEIPSFSITFETKAPAALPKSSAERAAYFAQAWARTLRAFPELHADWNEGNLQTFTDVKIAISVMAPAGVVTPVVSIPTNPSGNFASELADILKNAEVGKIALEYLTASTTGLVDLGNVQIVSATGILVKPQNTSVAFSSPDVNTLQYTITADHRISDPADVALLAARLVKELN
jgi:pyruvate dehydrogenase E2 component (dihydrolipoamide acetyltransferase)